MPRIRSIHYDAWKSEKLARATDGAERCYWRIHPYMDDQGRGEDHPKLIAATVFPLRDEVTADVMDGWLTELAGLGLVVRYEADGLRLVQIVKWSNYQHPQKPKRSEYPPAPAQSDTSTRPIPDPSGRGVLRSGVDTGEEGESEGEAGAPSSSAQPVDISQRRLAKRAAQYGTGGGA